jgi:hypothetical protein
MPGRAVRFERLWRLALGLSVAVGLGACELPTSAPKWQTKWEVPAESTTVGVSNFLPAGVTLAAPGGPLLVTVPTPAPITTSLGTICGALCAATATIPIPAFNNAGSPVSGSFALPAAVNSAIIVGGGFIDVAVTNNFSFDPLRPPGTAVRGSFRLKLTNGAVTVADTTIDGSIAALTPGVPASFHIALRPGTIGGGTLAYQATVTCPGSASTAAINPAHTFVVGPSVAAPGIPLLGASVALVSQAFSDSSAAFDMSQLDVDSSAVQAFALVLRIRNPFTVAGAFNATLSAPGVVPATHSLSLTPAISDSSVSNSVSVVNFTAAEFRRFLGHSGVRLKFAGTVTGTGPGNTVGVQASKKLNLQANLRTTLTVGGQ